MYGIVSKFYATQPQCIGNHRDRAKRHSRAGDDRTQEDAEERIENSGRDRNPQKVVNKGKEKVLPDIAHRRPAQAPGFSDTAQIALYQRYMSAFDRDVGA